MNTNLKMINVANDAQTQGTNEMAIDMMIIVNLTSASIKQTKRSKSLMVNTDLKNSLRVIYTKVVGPARLLLSNVNQSE